MNEFCGAQFCETCNEEVTSTLELDADVGFLHESTVSLTATRAFLCPNCGNTLKIENASRYIDLEWHD